MKIIKILAIIMLGLSLSSFLSSQEMQSGSIRGKVVDDNGQPLPGVAITISSPRLLGTVNATTTAEGLFRVPFLTPGSDYEIRAELSGFDTVIRKGIMVNVGKTISIEIQMSPSTIAKEITVVAPSPTVDVVKSETVKTIVSDTLASLPLPRNLLDGLKISAGVVSYPRGGLTRASISGHGEGETGFVIDGIPSNDSDNGFAYMGVDTGMAWDMVEEIELVTTGPSAANYNSMAGMINVITKSGGNKFSGEASFYYTNKHLVQVSLPKESLASLGLAAPSIPVYAYDTSFSLGGPIIKDKIWFLGEFRYLRREITGDFKPAVLAGKEYNSYNRTFPNYIGFFKLSARLASNIRAFAMGHLSYQNVPFYYSGWWRTDEANYNNRPFRFNYSGTVSWTINSNTILDLRAGGLYFKWQGLYTQPTNADSPQYMDDFSGYVWGNPGGEQYTYKPKININLTLTKFLDDFLGGNHEFKAGFEWERDRGDWGFYMKNPLFWHYYNGNPYYYRGLYGIDHADPVNGDGLLEFAAIGSTYGASAEMGITSRIGGFIQDSFTLKRLTVNLGVRADHLTAWSPGRTKGATADPLALAIGATYFQPQFGFNPYDAVTYDSWENAFPYGTFISPRLGLTYDLFGNGKTALKASFSLQQEPFITGTFSGMYPLTWRSYTFNWFDLNGNSKPDLPGIDNYVSIGDSPLTMLSKAYLNSIDPNVKIPYEVEVAVSIEHELVKDFNIGARYINRERKRIMGSVLYDQNTQRYWYTYEKASDWWVPFTTTIPAYGDYPAQTVTMYFQSNNAPDMNYCLTNIPEGKMRYQTLELSFEKRMSNGWQFGGSFNYTRMKGNYPMTLNSSYTMYVYSGPNSFVNSYGDLPFSRPVIIKLYGTFKLPYDFMFSFIYLHTDGTPWGRTVTVRPPNAWAAANNAKTWSYGIYVEPPGTRRDQPYDNLDIRMEKDFALGPGKVGFYIDIFNFLGAYTISDVKNPGGTWLPVDANSTQGVYTPGWRGLTGISGSRIFNFSILYRF